VGWRIIRHLWQQFRGLFLSGQRLSFPWHFLSQQVLCALRIPSVISGNNLRDDFWLVSDSVFLDVFWVNRCCARWGFLLSSLETIYVTISDWSATQFSFTFSESTGVVRSEDSLCHLWKQFSWWFLSGQRLGFSWHFLCNRCCACWGFLLSSLETVYVMISEWSGTQFSLTFSKSTGVVCAEDSMRHLWKQFRRLFLRRQRLSFPWLFMSQQGLCGLTNPFVTSESTFEGFLCVDTVSVFLDSLWVKRGCMGLRIISHLWQQFRVLFLSGQQLNFPWLFLCQQVLCALRIPSVICGNSCRDDF
jgi:hypothetical protein